VFDVDPEYEKRFVETSEILAEDELRFVEMSEMLAHLHSFSNIIFVLDKREGHVIIGIQITRTWHIRSQKGKCYIWWIRELQNIKYVGNTRPAAQFRIGQTGGHVKIGIQITRTWHIRS
jgi:hypothetical protein